jgi:phosphopantothenoylcysteine decarboxylase/phosphopantothenate--cysteine ligase
VAPATANTVNKLANGYADDMLTTLALAYEGPIVVAPAMNPSMYANETVVASLVRLQERGAFIVEPSEGDVACGEQGQGKLALIAEITSVVTQVASTTQALKGKKVLITSGPTEEPLDDVRMLTNRSSGKMGAAVARAALLMGANVTVVAGPQKAPLPLRATIERVTTAQEMLDAALKHAQDADLVIGVAAVADYRPAKRVEGKIRSGEIESIGLVANPDVIAELAKASKGRVVAFAAEPAGSVEVAKEKMARKGVHAIAVNDVSQGVFDSDSNALTLVFASGKTTSIERASKLRCALWLLGQLCEDQA